MYVETRMPVGAWVGDEKTANLTPTNEFPGLAEVELPGGTLFSVGTGLSDAERNNPPPFGAIITFRYQELSDDGVPRFPTYVGVRDDAVWET